MLGRKWKTRGYLTMKQKKQLLWKVGRPVKNLIFPLLMVITFSTTLLAQWNGKDKSDGQGPTCNDIFSGNGGKGSRGDHGDVKGKVGTATSAAPAETAQERQER